VCQIRCKAFLFIQVQVVIIIDMPFDLFHKYKLARNNIFFYSFIFFFLLFYSFNSSSRLYNIVHLQFRVYKIASVATIFNRDLA